MDIKSIYSGLDAIIRYSIRKILLNRRWVVVLLMLVFIGAIMGYAGSQEMDRLDGGVILMDLIILSFLMPIIAMIYGASLLRNEIDDKSITQVITAPLDRGISYLGYFISLVISLSLIMLLINLVGWLAFFGQKGMEGDAPRILLSMCGLAIIGSVAYSSLFLMTSVMFKRPIYFGLFFAFIWEGYVGTFAGVISQYTIKHFIRSIGSWWIDYGSLALYDGSSGAGFVLAFLVGFFLFIGIVLFREMEFT
ncbi:MAG: ABC transporter permease [Thermoplasmata archaeon]|nr:ABC transporter permease [Thermoplasmata archaeon]